MEQLKKKLEEIIDFELKETNKVWNEYEIKKFESKCNLKLPNDYAFYLQHYGNDYIKEKYRFTPTVRLPKKINETEFEIDSLYGLYNDENNIEDKINLYKQILPPGLFPIGDLPGGDLICFDIKDNKLNNIYIWFHEMEDKNVFSIADSFENFIKGFRSVELEKSNLNNVKLNVSNKLNDFLKNPLKIYSFMKRHP